MTKVEHLIKPSKSEILRNREARRISEFFGEPISVPLPPQQLIEAITVAKLRQIHLFAPHFLPLKKFDKHAQYPGWEIRPHEWFWEQIEKGELSQDASTLPGEWVLFDGGTPNRDPLKRLLYDLFERKSGRYAQHSFWSAEPRTMISANELDAMVYPEIYRMLNLKGTKVDVRSPKAIEFNFLGNLHYPYIANGANFTWLEDLHLSGSRLISGNAVRGSLSGIDWRLPNYHYEKVAFRPMIVFSR